MIKNFFIKLVLVLFLVGVLGVYLSSKFQKPAPQPQNTKAEEVTITLVEGWSNKEIAQYLEKQGIVSSKDFLEGTKHFPIIKYIQAVPEEAVGDLQGFLYPDTYRLFASVADRSKTTPEQASEEIISKLLNNFANKLHADAKALAQKRGLSLYEAITLASIVENETGRNAVSAEQKKALDVERKIVAGIFYNRLNSGMALQSDATVNYITGKNDPGVSEADTKIDSPYNTYKYRGLPPTPISNPSLSSISAVLNPTDTDYFYFLHEQETGKAIYAKTFEEHVQNKQKYLK